MRSPLRNACAISQIRKSNEPSERRFPPPVTVSSEQAGPQMSAWTEAENIHTSSEPTLQRWMSFFVMCSTGMKR